MAASLKAPSPPPLSPPTQVRFLSSSSCCSCRRSFPSSSSRSNIFFGRTLTGKTNGERGRRAKSRGGDDELNALDMLLRGRGEEATMSTSSSDENEDEQSAEKKKPMTTKPVVVVRDITVNLEVHLFQKCSIQILKNYDKNI